MTTSLNDSDRAKFSPSSDVVWDKLYHFLGAQVRYWVFSSHVSLWRGQEEDIVADIVQEAVTRVFTYSLEHPSWTKGGSDFPYKSFKKISIAIAHKQYRDLKRQDAQFICMRSRRSLPQKNAIVYEQVDPLGIADEALQEWPFECLVHEIVDFPDEERTALLIDLANRPIRSETQPTRLEQAFLEVGIRLQDYQPKLSEHSITLLCLLVCQRFMRQQKRFKEQDDIQTAKNHYKSVLQHKDSSLHNTGGDSMLIDLATHLDKTAPFAAVDPAFREALLDRLLNIQAQHSASEAAKMAANNVTETTGERSNTEIVSKNQESNSPFKDPGSVPIESDSKLTALATHLDKTAPFAAVDPAFRKALGSRLLNIQAQHSASEIAMITNNITEIADEALQEWPFECLVHEIVDFPDEERTALLIDLANRPIRSETQPTRLEQAFLEVGIRLQDYQPLLPQDPIESREHHFFLNRAYKRVVELQEAVLCPVNIEKTGELEFC